MEKAITLNFVGDICLQGVNRSNFEISPDVIEFIKKGTLNFANLESPVTESENKLPGKPINLKGQPTPNIFFELFDVFSLANNHIMDYGVQGLKDTINFLKEEKKNFFGAGLNLREAERPLKITTMGFKIAFIGFTRYNEAKLDSPGAAPYKIRRICNTVRSLKDQGFFVVVVPHWNYQWVDFPSPFDWGNGHKLIEAGADLIVGSHPHIIQGVEEYKGRFIFHSLGNFVFKPTKFSQKNQNQGKTFILSVKIRPDFSYSYNLFNIFSDEKKIRPMKGFESSEFNAHLTKISVPLKDKKILKKEFYNSSVKIDNFTNKVFQDMAREHGYLSVLRDLTRANRQDIKKRLYSTYIQIFKKST